MSRRALLARPHWQPFLHLPGFNRLPPAALFAADDFFGHVALHGLADPDAHDVAAWAKARDPGEVAALLEDLATALAICIPAFVQRVNEASRLARQAAREETKAKVAVEPSPATAAAPWDPLAPPSRKPPRPRRVSVEPRDLPLEMRENLRRMALGLPKNGVAVCASITRRLREKVCQLVWSAREAGLAAVINDKTAARYQADVEARSAEGKNGLRWATVRASIEEIDRYARYAGLPSEIRTPISERLAVLQRREAAQKALKFAALAATGNTTLSVLDKADELLERSVKEADPRRRHRLRNGACILGLYPIAPLRNASAALAFDRTLFWLDGAWVIHTRVQKTSSHNPEPFVMTLEPQHGKFIDAVILGDADQRHLPELREQVLASQRLLFLLPDGKPTAQTYVPRIYKSLTRNSFTTTRTMIHTECATAHGLAGRNMAMAVCHQTSARVAEKYKADAVGFAAMARRQATASERRASYGLAADLGEL